TESMQCLSKTSEAANHVACQSRGQQQPQANGAVHISKFAVSRAQASLPRCCISLSAFLCLRPVPTEYSLTQPLGIAFTIAHQFNEEPGNHLRHGIIRIG